jgi:tellurite methyltransferase
MKKNLALQYTHEFWNKFYSENIDLNEPSLFAKWFSANYLKNNSSILELGCGNGRDSFYLCSEKHSVYAIDASKSAITNNIAKNKFNSLKFIELNMIDLNNKSIKINLPKFNVVYSRFFLHAVPEYIENEILKFCNENLTLGDVVAHEFRTTNDSLFSLGEEISTCEKYTDHYRRFIEVNSFKKKIDPEFWETLFITESSGLAPFREQDPVVCRIVLKKIK